MSRSDSPVPAVNPGSYYLPPIADLTASYSDSTGFWSSSAGPENKILDSPDVLHDDHHSRRMAQRMVRAVRDRERKQRAKFSTCHPAAAHKSRKAGKKHHNRSDYVAEVGYGDIFGLDSEDPVPLATLSPLLSSSFDYTLLPLNITDDASLIQEDIKPLAPLNMSAAYKQDSSLSPSLDSALEHSNMYAARDVRSFERARSRVKTSAKFVRRRQQRAQGVVEHRRQAGKGRRPQRINSLAIDSDESGASTDDEIQIPTEVSLSMVLEDAEEKHSKSSVDLYDLVRTAKVKLIKERDFEMVPRVRTSAAVPELDLEGEESWEHIWNDDLMD